jgi:hypothetical protein
MLHQYTCSKKSSLEVNEQNSSDLGRARKSSIGSPYLSLTLRSKYILIVFLLTFTTMPIFNPSQFFSDFKRWQRCLGQFDLRSGRSHRFDNYIRPHPAIEECPQQFFGEYFPRLRSFADG